MTGTDDRNASAGRRTRDLKVAVVCVAAVLGMTGLSFASVPLYRWFCQVTGYGGTTQVATSADGVEVIDREINVRFDANVAPGLAWEFKADEPVIRVRLGEMRTTFYRARNVSDRPLTGSATFNVTPAAAGPYFSKIACFCFTEQTLEPGEEIEMGVTFYVDPAMLEDPDIRTAQTITLSYTFFKAARPEEPLAAAPDADDADPT